MATSTLDSFMSLLLGRFDNREQFEAKKAAGKVFPFARHVNTACNDKILGLPADFPGVFTIEESYYETDGKKILVTAFVPLHRGVGRCFADLLRCAGRQ